MPCAIPNRRSSALAFAAIRQTSFLEVTDNGSGIANAEAASREGFRIVEFASEGQKSGRAI